MDLQRFASELVEATREYVYIRPEDGLIILRPNRLNFLNETATLILRELYAPGGPDVAAVVRTVQDTYGVDEERVRDDLLKLLQSLSAVLNDNICEAPSARITPFGSHKRELPVLSEIALTYNCQNRCTFCYADSPKRGREVSEMTTTEVQTIIDRIYGEAHCPTVSFTGGEPTLRQDLPELIAYAKSRGGPDAGMRVNLITNGIRCADTAYVAALAEAGLDSAQVSIEGGTAAVHDAITRHPGSWAKSVQAVHHLRAVGIHTHTNTTICSGNREHLLELVDFIADELGPEYFSMNMVIRTGAALESGDDPSAGELTPNAEIRYSDVGDLIRLVQQRADEKGVRLVWYSPVPYCLFNPVQAGLGSKSCACVDGLISINPAGELLPCSSFERGIGDLLHRPFRQVWYSRTARYWRDKEFLPPLCQRCDIRDICCGACPLYWDECGSFEELRTKMDAAPPMGATLRWKMKKALWSGTWGVGLRKP